MKFALKHVSRTFAPLQKRPSKLRANLPHCRSYGDVTAVPHPPPKPGNFNDKCLWKLPGFGPPPWWGGSISKKSRSEAKHEDGQCLKEGNRFLIS